MTLETLTDDSPVRGLAETLQRQLATKRDLIADTRRVTFAENGHTPEGEVPLPALALTIDMPDGAEDFTVTDHAHGQIAAHHKIDRRFYDRLRGSHPDLFVNLLNGLLEREPSKRMLRTMDGRVRAFLSNRYRPRDNWDLMEQAVLPVLNDYRGQVVFRSCDLTETRMYVRIVLPEIQRPVTPKVGDVMSGGVLIQNSEVGAGALVIAPYTEILWCTNGQTHLDYGQRSRHVGRRIESSEEAWEFYSDETLQLDDAAFFAKCRDTLTGTLNETIFEAIVSQMRDLAGMRMPGDPVAQVETIAKREKLTEGEQGSMLEALIAGADLTGWGYLNAMTAMARDLDSPDRQAELQKVAGRMIAEPEWARVLA